MAAAQLHGAPPACHLRSSACLLAQPARCTPPHSTFKPRQARVLQELLSRSEHQHVACRASASTATRPPTPEQGQHQNPILESAHDHKRSRPSTAPQPHPNSASASPLTTHEWSGLAVWRAKGVDQGRFWGAHGPDCSRPSPGSEPHQATPLAGSLVECAVQVLRTACPYAKCALTHRAWAAYNQGDLPLHPPGLPCITSLVPQPTQDHTTPPQQQQQREQQQTQEPQQQQQHQEQQQTHSTPGAGIAGEGLPQPCSHHASRGPVASGAEPVEWPRQGQPEGGWATLPTRPARPARPQLVAPKELPSYELGQSPLSSLSAHMLHNLAHIELNAIDLAWDTVARWAGLRLPNTFYEDFARVADDESRHLGWCLQRLGELGHEYGDMDAHDKLWAGCAVSAGSLTCRLAVVPMSQEARGLDAGQRLVCKLKSSGDARTAGLVERISEEEHAHVAVGVAWFRRVCAALDLQAVPLFHQHVSVLTPDLLKGPFHHAAREKVGLQRAFYDTTRWPPESLAVMNAAAAARRRSRHTHTARTDPDPDHPAHQPRLPPPQKDQRPRQPDLPVLPGCSVDQVAAAVLASHRQHLHASQGQHLHTSHRQHLPTSQMQHLSPQGDRGSSGGEGVGHDPEGASSGGEDVGEGQVEHSSDDPEGGSGESVSGGQEEEHVGVAWSGAELEALLRLKQRLQAVVETEGLAAEAGGSGR